MTPEPSLPGDAPPARREALASLTREALRSIDRGVVVVSTDTCSMAPLLRGGERIHWRRGHGPRRGNRPAPDVEPVAAADVVGVVVAVERDDRLWDLRGRGPRLYAAGAVLLSLAGGVLYRAAVLADAVLRRLVPGGRDVRLARPATWLLVRGARAVFHLLFFRACHGPGRPVEEDSDR